MAATPACFARRDTAGTSAAGKVAPGDTCDALPYPYLPTACNALSSGPVRGQSARLRLPRSASASTHKTLHPAACLLGSQAGGRRSAAATIASSDAARAEPRLGAPQPKIAPRLPPLVGAWQFPFAILYKRARNERLAHVLTSRLDDMAFGYDWLAKVFCAPIAHTCRTTFVAHCQTCVTPFLARVLIIFAHRAQQPSALAPPQRAPVYHNIDKARAYHFNVDTGQPRGCSTAGFDVEHGRYFAGASIGDGQLVRDARGLIWDSKKR